MRTQIKLALASLALSLAAAQPASAQTAGLVASPPAARSAVSSDIDQLVQAAYPVYDDATLARRLSSAASTLAARRDDVAVRSLVGIERVMGIAPSNSTATEVDSPTANYRVNASTGKAFAALKNDSYEGLTSDRFSVLEGPLQVLESAFLSRLGLPSDELMKVSYRRIMAQSLVEGSRDNSDGTPALVRRGVTFASRGFAGFPIEGCEARASSFTGQQVDLFGLRWPRFQPHRLALSVRLDASANIKRAIADQVRRAALPGDLLSLYMGVVFRPARTTAGQLVHVPVMKVVVTPQPKLQSLQTGSMLTEGGAVFYADILATPPTDLVNGDQTDENTTAP